MSENNPIYHEIKYLKGVGERRAFQFNKLKIYTILDLMEHFPRDYINRNSISKIADIDEDMRCSVVAKIANIERRSYSRGNNQLTLLLTDGEDFLYCTWFKVGNWLIDKFKLGQKLWVSGYIKLFRNNFQIIHPEFEILDSDENDLDFWHKRNLLPIYPLTGNLKMSVMRNAILKAFELYHTHIEETLPNHILENFGWKSRDVELQKVHFATTIQKAHDAKRRFAFEELFFNQLMLGRVKKKRKIREHSYKFKIKRTCTTALKKSLPFKLTNAQVRSLNEIVKDMSLAKQMTRLLQGDVGSGKTIVTLFAMLFAVENGYQAALMAPTELLVEQHFKNISKLLNNQTDINIGYLKGGSYKGKKNVLKQIASGEIDIIIGTHALIQKDVNFAKLGFIAIDEQHRFGVKQRSFLSQKNEFPHLLYLSATPIPRSLALTMYGDLDLSIIDELPPNRKKITTVWKTANAHKQVYEEIRKLLKNGRQAYFVCPLIEESEKMDLLDTETLYGDLSQRIYPDFKIALLHGKMKSAEKDEIMRSFMDHKIDILVSTTVIEVGIDVANATVMAIEHAERFGLSQLHQLRGRVGRGAEQSFCYLMSYNPISAGGKERLSTMVQTTDGFKIAEKDLELRGPGEFFGKEQSGFAIFKFADLYKDRDLLEKARRIAFDIVETDYNFEDKKNSVIKKNYFKNFKSKEVLFEF